MGGPRGPHFMIWANLRERGWEVGIVRLEYSGGGKMLNN